MRKASLVLFLLLTLPASFSPAARADRYEDLMGVYHPYKYVESASTPAPKGYKPFYISHIGRHGSRYPVNAAYVANGLSPLSAADSLGLLTPEGRRLLKCFRNLDIVSRGTYGLISELGAQEHRQIAARMAERFPELFSGRRGRDSVACFCTHKQRAILSMTNFASVLAARAPRMKMSFAAGERWYDVLCAEDKAASGLKRGSRKADAAMAERFDFRAFYARIFNDPSAGRKLVKNDRLMAETCFTNGTVAAALGYPELMRFLTPEEYEVTALVYNAKMYYQHCGSAEQGEWRMHIMDNLVADFVTRADRAVMGNAVAADLRFSHDVGLMPFFSLIGLKGFDTRVTFEEASDVWDSSVLMPMACNLQMVFYSNRRGDILVKLLLNEVETCIPALGPGPWYSWPELRSYLVSLITGGGF